MDGVGELIDNYKESQTLLREALEYMEHQSWRCAHPPHYYLAGDPPADGDCACGLLKFEERVREAVGSPSTGDDKQ